MLFQDFYNIWSQATKWNTNCNFLQLQLTKCINLMPFYIESWQTWVAGYLVGYMLDNWFINRCCECLNLFLIRFINNPGFCHRTMLVGRTIQCVFNTQTLWWLRALSLYFSRAILSHKSMTSLEKNERGTVIFCSSKVKLLPSYSFSIGEFAEE